MGASERPPEAQAKPGQRRTWSVSEILTIAAILLPAIGYAAAYEFRLGGVHAMGLPEELLSLDLRDIIAGGLAVLTAGALMFGIVSFFSWMISGDDVSEIERSLVDTLVPTGVMGALFFVSGQFTTAAWIGFLIAVALLVAGEFIPPLLTQRQVKGFEAKLQAYRQREFDLRPTRLMRFRGSRRQFVLAISLAYLVLQIASPVGAFVARGRTTYAVVRSNPQRLVVSTYGGSLVTLAYDPESREASSPVVVIRPEDVSAGLYVEHTGPVSFVTGE
ncbi:MAG: hypothetical protein U1E29_04445 [Coriobacteriia bacterium]|nr:hypothetical protein [Coriobacteriia bacterium]